MNLRFLLFLFSIAKALLARTRRFRVLALSATPGDNVKTVQEVISNLLINTVEVRTDDAMDIRPYINRKRV
jgi:ERCC4-related helicase